MWGKKIIGCRDPLNSQSSMRMSLTFDSVKKTASGQLVEWYNE